MNHPLKLIVGLGNPGAQYAHTRHNAGEDFIEALARSVCCDLKPESKFFGRAGDTLIGSNKVRLFVPDTFMNLSGKAVGAIANFYKISPENILVAYDELDLAPGVAKLKFGGGHGGHNGIRDIISSLGNVRDFYRLRLGIGHPGSAKLVSNYVLSKSSPDDRISMESVFDQAIGVMPLACAGKWNDAMKILHTQPSEQAEEK